MAIGLGRMLGFHYLENFNYPYMATSITDFWRRWHISLSTFFRDYVYIPMGGSRVDKLKWIRNILIVWLLTGFWHGAQWNYILWGIYYGILLLLEKLIMGKLKIKIPKLLQHVYSLTFILFGWIIFKMEDIAAIPKLIGAMLGVYGLGSMEFLIFTRVLIPSTFPGSSVYLRSISPIYFLLCFFTMYLFHRSCLYNSIPGIYAINKDFYTFYTDASIFLYCTFNLVLNFF